MDILNLIAGRSCLSIDWSVFKSSELSLDLHGEGQPSESFSVKQRGGRATSSSCY